MNRNNNQKNQPESLANILQNKESSKKPPAHRFQDLALRVIEELKIPNFKRGAVFKVCKENPPQEVMKAMNDTKELCQTGAKWKYFFKVIAATRQDDKKVE